MDLPLSCPEIHRIHQKNSGRKYALCRADKKRLPRLQRAFPPLFRGKAGHEAGAKAMLPAKCPPPQRSPWHFPGHGFRNIHAEAHGAAIWAYAEMFSRKNLRTERKRSPSCRRIESLRPKARQAHGAGARKARKSRPEKAEITPAKSKSASRSALPFKGGRLHFPQQALQMPKALARNPGTSSARKGHTQGASAVIRSREGPTPASQG